MEDRCPKCGSAAGQVKPPKYSPDDKYAEMKRKIKADEYKDRGLLSDIDD